MKSELIPFTKELLPEANKLLAKRHQHNRRVLPELPARFEDAAVGSKAIEALWNKKTASGFAAICDGKLVAYLIGEITTQTWGRCGYVYLPGYAVAEGESPALIQDLYTLLGDEWVKKGCFNHYLYISAADGQIIDALFDLGLGKERVDALLDLRSAVIPDVEEPVGITIRPAGKGDYEYLASLSDVIMRALAEAPYWHPTVPEAWDELREGWSELADDEEWRVWLALENNVALGTVGFRPEWEEDTQMLAFPRTVYLSVAATKPQARGTRHQHRAHLAWPGAGAQGGI